jgi:phage replication O-like protein O
MGFQVPQFTQIPNEYFDIWLKKLTSVESRVLQIVMRKTFGWHKTRDRISLTQLVSETGSNKTNVSKAVKKLESYDLIKKEVIGENGTQQTFYELVIREDSNNSYRYQGGTPTGTKVVPTKEITKESIPSISISKDIAIGVPLKPKVDKRPTAPNISLNFERRRFEGFTDNDIQAWKEKFPKVDVMKELDLCAEWAMSTPRKNYRKSILTWLTNVGKGPKEKPIEQTQETINAEQNLKWVIEFKEKEKHYDIRILKNYVEDIYNPNIEFPLKLPCDNFQQQVTNYFKSKGK